MPMDEREEERREGGEEGGREGGEGNVEEKGGVERSAELAA